MESCKCGAPAVRSCDKCGDWCFCQKCAESDAGRQVHKETCKERRRMVRHRVQRLPGGGILLHVISLCRRWRRCPAALRFVTWVGLWFLCLEFWLPNRDFANKMEVHQEIGAPASLEEIPPEPSVVAAEQVFAPTLPPVVENPPTAVVNQEAAFTHAAEADGSAFTPMERKEVSAPTLPPVVENPPTAVVNQVNFTSPAAGASMATPAPPAPAVPKMVEIVEVPGNCGTAINSSRPLTQACCKTAVMRFKMTDQMRSEYLRNSRLPMNVRQWWEHMAHPVRRLYVERQAALHAGRPWSGVAVLLAGQVRDGTKHYIVENIHRHLFQEMLDAHIRYHIFAVLEFTRNGFSWRGSKNQNRSFNATDVTKVLQRYGNGGNFTLLEWTQKEMTRAETLVSENCTWTRFEGQGANALPLQYVKVSKALQLMREAEEDMGHRFALVVRIRPDVSYDRSLGNVIRSRLEEAKGPVNSTVPNICGSIGGGLGDALLMADRSSAEALDAVAGTIQGCKIKADECQSWESIKNTCMNSRGLASGSMLNELCAHGWIPTMLRHGVPTTSCNIGGHLGSPSG